jgi:hypothetical protein
MMPHGKTAEAPYSKLGCSMWNAANATGVAGESTVLSTAKRPLSVVFYEKFPCAGDPFPDARRSLQNFSEIFVDSPRLRP